MPYVLETSIGLDRMFLAVMSASYLEEKLEDGSARTVLKIPPVLAPYKVAVLPLVDKDGLPEKALKIMDDIKLDFNAICEAKDSIGKRYRRQDAIGTPYCVTIDNDTMEDDSVTIRDRDTMQQERVSVAELKDRLKDKTDLNKLLRSI